MHAISPSLLDELEAAAPRLRSRTVPLHLFMLALEGQHELAAELAADWLRRARGGPEDLWSRQVTPVLAAMMLAAAGRFAEADEVVQRMERCMHAPAESELAWTRMALALAHAVVAHQRGQRRVEAQHLRTAVTHAASAGVDDDLVPRLYDALRDRAADGRATRDHDGHRLVIDGRHHEIRSAERRLSLGARPALRALLYAFASAPSNHLTRAMIARVLWSADYDPLRHDSTIKSSIRRLRVLLAGIAQAHSEHDGYHLVLPDDTLFIPPFASR